MDYIKELNDSKIITNILNISFLDFAKEYNFTRENAPNHLAFINSDSVKAWLNMGLKMYGYTSNEKVIGCVSYSYLKDKIYLIQRLAVLPEYQRKGIGKKLMNFVENEIKNIGGEISELHATDLNIPLREWYKKQGYVELRIEDVKIPGIEKVPFRSCVMNKNLDTIY